MRADMTRPTIFVLAVTEPLIGCSRVTGAPGSCRTMLASSEASRCSTPFAY